MTREEELDWLCRLRSKIYVYMPKEWLIPMNNALDMAIKALGQEPSDDCVSRSRLISKLEILDRRYGSDFYWETRKIVDKLPSVTPPQRIGHCEDCKHFHKLPYHADALGKCIHHGGFCPKGDWYCADFEPQEGE